MRIEFVVTDERGVGTADKRRSTQIPSLFYPRQSEFIRGSSSRRPYPRIWEGANFSWRSRETVGSAGELCDILAIRIGLERAPLIEPKRGIDNAKDRSLLKGVIYSL